MNTVVYPGSFDPVTNGHYDIIERCSKLFDNVIVGVLINPDKTETFTVEERIDFIKRVTRMLPNVKVMSFSGLLIDFMKQTGARIIIKGLRAVSDFEYEFQMALMNRQLSPDVETVFMTTSAANSFLSSSSIKQVASLDGCIKGLVPAEIIPDIMAKIKKI